MKHFIFKKETWMSVLGVFSALLVLIILLPFSVGNSSKTKSYEGYTVEVDYGKGIQKKFWGLKFLRISSSLIFQDQERLYW